MADCNGTSSAKTFKTYEKLFDMIPGQLIWDLIFEPYINIQDVGRLDYAMTNKPSRENFFLSAGCKLPHTSRSLRSRSSSSTNLSVPLMFYGMRWQYHEVTHCNKDRDFILWLHTRGIQIYGLCFHDIQAQDCYLYHHFHDMKLFISANENNTSCIKELLPFYHKLQSLRVDIRDHKSLKLIKKLCPHITSLRTISHIKLDEVMTIFPKLTRVEIDLTYPTIYIVPCDVVHPMSSYPMIDTCMIRDVLHDMRAAHMVSFSKALPNLASLECNLRFYPLCGLSFHEAPDDAYPTAIFPKLKQLTLKGAHGHGLSSFVKAIPSIENLIISSQSLCLAALDATMTCLPALKELTIENSHIITEETLSAMAIHCPLIETLTFRNVSIPHGSVISTSSKVCQHLKTITFERCDFSEFHDLESWWEDSIWSSMAVNLSSISFLFCRLSMQHIHQFVELTKADSVKLVVSRSSMMEVFLDSMERIMRGDDQSDSDDEDDWLDDQGDGDEDSDNDILGGNDSDDY